MIEMSRRDLVVSLVAAFLGTFIASLISLMVLEAQGMAIILASTGASAILIFFLPFSPVSQPWNLVGGHLVSAVVGVSCYIFIPSSVLAASASIPLAMLLMHLARCMHPPGGATAITAVVGGVDVHALGYTFVAVPVMLNSLILLSIAMASGTLRDKNPFEINDPDNKGE